MGDEDGEVSAPRKRARPFLFEIAKEKYELYRIEVEQQKQQQQRQHQMMLLQQQTKKLARGQNCSSLPYPPNMGPTSGMGSNHAGINSNVSYMELPNVADHTLTRTPEWQSMWRSPPTFTRPLEIDISLVGSDLNEHFEAGAPTQELSEDGTIELEGMLRVFGFELESESIGFITYRNNLNKIMATPYERNSWKMKVYRIRNTVHLEVIRVDEQESEFHLRTQHWGRQFEALCKGQSSPSEKMEHCAIFKAKLNSHRLVIAAEVDACQSNDPKSYVEVKTTKTLTTEHERWYFMRHKMLRFWIQCYLAGIQTIIVGFRDERGMLTNLVSYETLKIPALIGRERSAMWDMDVCLNFTDKTLSFLQAHVVEDREYVLEYQVHSDRDRLTLKMS